MSDRRLDAPVIVPCQPQAARCNNGQREVCDGAGRWQVEREPCAVTAGLAAGPAHTCALRIDGRVKCWGINEFGQLGIGDQNNRGDGPGEMGARLPAVDLGMGRFATAIATGSSHSCAILDNAQVKCWGSNRSGQLGIGQNPPLGDPYENRGDNPDEMGDQLPEVDLGQGRSAIAIALGRAHTCALLDNRELKCWGANGAGQLGIGDTVDRGKKPEEMGDALPAVRFGSGLAFDVKAGEDHTCAIIDGNAVHCWGSNFGGVLGLGDTRDRGGSPSDLGPNLPRVDFGSDANGPLEALILATGPFHNCVYLTNHELKCWGRNAVGELGLNDTRPRGALPGDMGSMLPATLTLQNDDVTQLALGYNHTCASVNQDLECWGSNLSGQLGISGRSQLGGEPDDIPLSLRPVELGPGRIGVITAAGSQHTCALLDDFRIKCWGANQHGELGLEDTLPRFIEPGQGDKLPAVDLGP